MNIPQLGTARLRLRAFQQRDLDAYAALCVDPEVMRHIGGGGPVGRDVAWRQIALFSGERALQRNSNDRLIGRVVFCNPRAGPTATWPGRWPATAGAKATRTRPRRRPAPLGATRWGCRT